LPFGASNRTACPSGPSSRTTRTTTGGAVKNLNRTEEELARVTKDTPPYARDHGAAAAKYVDAFIQNIQWDEVNRRLQNAQRRAA
jgi:hypothetical protein